MDLRARVVNEAKRCVCENDALHNATVARTWRHVPALSERGEVAAILQAVSPRTAFELVIAERARPNESQV